MATVFCIQVSILSDEEAIIVVGDVALKQMGDAFLYVFFIGVTISFRCSPSTTDKWLAGGATCRM